MQLRSLASGTMSKKFSIFKPPRLWYIFKAALADQYTILFIYLFIYLFAF